MRVTCPACGARYEVDDDAIPQSGRRVQCSACQAEWRATPLRPSATAASRSAQFIPAQSGAAQSGAALLTTPSPDGAPIPATAQRQPQPTAMIASLQGDAASRGRSGFLVGFGLVALLAFAAVTLYAKQAAITTAAPTLAAPLNAYVSAVDRGRLLLAETVAQLRRGD